MPESFNQRMRAAREAAGMSLMDVAVELRRLLPKSEWASPPKLHRLETVTPEDRVDSLLLYYLAGMYGVRVSELSESKAQFLEPMRDFLMSLSRCRVKLAG